MNLQMNIIRLQGYIMNCSIAIPVHRLNDWLGMKWFEVVGCFGDAWVYWPISGQ
jgi:hypothetical protein